jgi:hypothetical protein
MVYNPSAIYVGSYSWSKRCFFFYFKLWISAKLFRVAHQTTIETQLWQIFITKINPSSSISGVANMDTRANRLMNIEVNSYFNNNIFPWILIGFNLKYCSSRFPILVPIALVLQCAGRLHNWNPIKVVMAWISDSIPWL